MTKQQTIETRPEALNDAELDAATGAGLPTQFRTKSAMGADGLVMEGVEFGISAPSDEDL